MVIVKAAALIVGGLACARSAADPDVRSAKRAAAGPSRALLTARPPGPSPSRPGLARRVSGSKRRSMSGRPSSGQIAIRCLCPRRPAARGL